MLKQKNRYAPDILDCISNLSNDEVFTSPKLANQMLDMLPQELFTNPKTKFLDPCTKSGVFLREIAKRLDKGLEDIIPDRQQRFDHILHNQVFGIAITELTAQLSRRTLYCSKYACAIKSGDIWISDDKDTKHGIHEKHSYSISEFTKKDENDFCLSAIQGNIRFNKEIKHKFDKNGTCILCGANNKQFKEIEHVYELIHMTDKQLEVLKNMQFDVIIGNPPYQLTDTSLSASATPIYNIFIEQAKKLQPRYLTMIIPSRWMAGGKGLDDFRNIMINDKHITQLHDFINSQDCFNGVDIKGGVCYFLRERDIEKKCNITTHNNGNIIKSKRYLKEENLDIFIRQSELININKKVWTNTSQESFSKMVSVRKPYGLSTDFFNPTIQIEKDNKKQKIATTVEKKYGLITPSETPYEDGYEVLGLLKNKRVWKYLEKNYKFPKSDGLGKYKIFVPKAYGCGAIGEVPSTPVLGTPVLGTPVQVCTETFVEIGYFNSKNEANNAFKYLRSKFFRCLVGIYKQTQDASSRVYQAVPIQDFTNESDINWSETIEEIDKQLYKKYNLSDEEIKFIEDNIEEMKIDENKED